MRGEYSTVRTSGPNTVEAMVILVDFVLEAMGIDPDGATSDDLFFAAASVANLLYEGGVR